MPDLNSTFARDEAAGPGRSPDSLLAALADPVLVLSPGGILLDLYFPAGLPDYFHSHPQPGAEIMSFLPLAVTEAIGQFLTGYGESREPARIELHVAGSVALCLELAVKRAREGEFVVTLRDRTTQRDRERTLALMSRIVAHTNNLAVFTDRRRRIQWVNDAFTRSTGYTLPEVLGKTPGEVLQGPETDPDTVRRIRQHLNNEEGFREEILNYDRDGRPYWLLMEIQPVRSPSGELEGFIAIETDITERKQTETLLRAREEEVKTLLLNVPGIIFQLVRAGRGRYRLPFASNYERIIGLEGDALGRDMSILLKRIHPEDLPAFFERIELSALHLSLFQYDFRYQHPIDGEIWVRMSARPGRERNGTVVWNGYAEDVTQRKAMEAGVVQAKKEAQEANEAKTEFLTNMSHELRTPLSGIIGIAALLAQSDLDPQQRNWLNLLQQSAHHQLALINDLLDMAKIEARKVEMENAPISLRPFVESIIGMFAKEVGDKQLELDYCLEGAYPQIAADTVRLRQILVNLLGNAIKFTKRGRVGLDVRRSSDGWWHFTVSDTGPGIAGGDLATIFRPFTQVGQEDVHASKGTGLGLSIVHRIVALMGGRVSVESKLGEGSSFHVSIPAGETAEELPRKVQGSPLLIVLDRESRYGRCIDSLLSGSGIRTVHAASIEDAMARLKRNSLPGPTAVLFPRPNDSASTDGARNFVKQWPAQERRPLLAGLRYPQAVGENAFDRLLTYPLTRDAMIDLFEAASAAPLTAAKENPVPATPEGLRILVAEDYLPNLEIMGFQLEAMGQKADFAEDGEAAMAALLARPYDLAILDLKMPGKSGFAIAEMVRSQWTPSWPRPHLVACTGDLSAPTVEKCRQLGINSFMPKPVDLRKLRELLQALVLRRDSPELDLINEKHLSELFELAVANNTIPSLRRIFLTLAHRVPEELERLRGMGDDREGRNELLHKLKGSLSSLCLLQPTLRIEMMEAEEYRAGADFQAALDALGASIVAAWDRVRATRPELGLENFPDWKRKN